MNRSEQEQKAEAGRGNKSADRARHIDCSLIQANLRLSPAARLRQQEKLGSDISALRRATKRSRRNIKRT